MRICAAAEIATVLGQPESTLDFVQKIIRQSIRVGKNTAYESTSSTWVYSILAEENITSSVSIEAVSASGTATHADIAAGLTIGTQFAPVVYTHVGPITNALCKVMSKHPETAFVVIAGNQAIELDAKALSYCLSDNILFTSALNQQKASLELFSNWSTTLVRIAAPSREIKTINPDGSRTSQTSSTLGSARVAARLAVLARNNPNLRGADLIDQFLKHSTTSLPALVGKVANARALIF